MTNFLCTVRVPTGQIRMDKRGVVYRAEIPGDWYLPLTDARKVFEAALRTVEVLLEVEGHTIQGSVAPPDGPRRQEEGEHRELTDRLLPDGRGDAEPPSSDNPMTGATQEAFRILCAVCPSRYDHPERCCLGWYR